MDHLTAVLNYIALTVVPMLIPISQINSLLSDDKTLIDSNTLDGLSKQIELLK
jgi:hypothetical protein